MAIGVGSLQAELSNEEFAYMKGWAASSDFYYTRTKEVAGVKCHEFQSDKRQEVAYIPIVAGNIGEAKAAFVASRIMWIHATELANALAAERYAEGYAKGQKAATESRPEPEIRKAVPVAAK